MSNEPALWDRIRADPTTDDDLRRLADEFEAAAKGFYAADPQTHTAKQFLGAAARCRLAWCKHSGKPLV